MSHKTTVFTFVCIFYETGFSAPGAPTPYMNSKLKKKPKKSGTLGHQR